MDNGGTVVSISPYISSASVTLDPAVVTSSTEWITYPGSLYLGNDTAAGTVVEGQSYQLVVYRTGEGLAGELVGTLSYESESAVSGTDYVFPDSVPPSPGRDGQVPLGNSVGGVSFTVQTIEDAADEPNEIIGIYLNEESGSIYTFTATGNDWTSGFAFDTGTLFSSPLSDYVTILDNESGSVDFLQESGSTVTQNSSIIIAVSRGPEGDFAATATIDQYSGTALQDRDYTGLPASVYWEDQETGTKTFTITTINAWATASAATLGINFSTLVNLETGSTIPTEEITITNNVISPSVSDVATVSPDYTINVFKKMSSIHRRRTAQVPFKFGIFGVSNIRERDVYSASLGGNKNSTGGSKD